MELPNQAWRLEINDNRRRLFDVNGPIAFVCECGEANCARSVVLTSVAYDAARARGELMLAPDHGYAYRM